MTRSIPPDWHLRARLKARQLALLVAIADHRSLRRAAQAIAVTQPAATRMLADLEDALGVTLFDRLAWGMRADVNALLARARLTPPGDVIETVSIVATLALLQGSDAVAVLPVDLAGHYAEQGLLARLPLELPAGGGTTQLLTRANRRLAPVAQQFVAALRHSAASALAGTSAYQKHVRQRPGRDRRL